MTKEQMQQALEMKDKGLSWLIIASYFKLTPRELRKHRKHYEEQTNNICTVVKTR